MKIGTEVHYFERSLFSQDCFCKLAKLVSNGVPETNTFMVFYDSEVVYKHNLKQDEEAKESMTYHLATECPWGR